MSDKKKILVIEDDRDIRRNLKDLLESEGYFVVVADNGQTALDLLAQPADLPSAILLDLMMPVMDGFQFREQQAKITRIAGIPVVVMSADNRLDEKKHILRAAHALKKPLDIDMILELVKKIVA